MKFRFAQSMTLRLLSSGLLLSVLPACSDDKGTPPSQINSIRSNEKIGLLFASHGDIDDYAKDLEDYIKVSFQKNVGIPLPLWSRKLVEEPAYRLSVKNVRGQYEKIGPTRYYANSLKQRDAINEEFKTILPNAKAYVGFNFAHPYIEETLDEMKKDGITTIVVINKGAQFSYASSGENMEDVLKYLEKNPSYDAEAIGVAYYGYDRRFINVMAKSVTEDIKKTFPGVPSKEICVFLGSHGLPQWLINKGDSAVTQMKRSVVELRAAMPEYKIYHGFLNDDFFPGAKWVSPKSSDVAPQLVDDGCKNIAMDGRLSFTTHHRATLYDMNVVDHEFFDSESAKLKAKDPTSPGIRSVLLPNFDTNVDHARLIATITAEALQKKGLTIQLKKKGEAALPVGSIGKPGIILKDVTHLGEDVPAWSPFPRN